MRSSCCGRVGLRGARVSPWTPPCDVARTSRARCHSRFFGRGRRCHGPAGCDGRRLPHSERDRSRRTLRQVVDAIREIATTLAAMHARGISPKTSSRKTHFSTKRDGRSAIRPPEFAGNLDQTEVGERIVLIYDIAPEMVNPAATSSWMRWMSFCLQRHCGKGDGTYLPFAGPIYVYSGCFRIGSYVLEEGTSSLDALIAACTSVEPNSRPSMQRLREELDAWLAPKPEPVSPVALDVSAFKAQLEARAAEVRATRERERENQELVQRSGLRFAQRRGDSLGISKGASTSSVSNRSA